MGQLHKGFCIKKPGKYNYVKGGRVVPKKDKYHISYSYYLAGCSLKANNLILHIVALESGIKIYTNLGIS